MSRMSLRIMRGCGGAFAGLLLALVSQPAPAAIHLDAAVSRVDFTVKTRWGQALQGTFPTLTGEVVEREDGQRQVHLRIPTGDALLPGHPRYTRLMRGEGFFDVEHHPDILFESDPHPAALAVEGGRLGGFLTIRGIRRREVLSVAPASCERPGLDCDVVVTGTVYRGDYRMDDWSIALSDRVQLALRIRARDDDR